MKLERILSPALVSSMLLINLFYNSEKNIIPVDESVKLISNGNNRRIEYIFPKDKKYNIETVKNNEYLHNNISDNTKMYDLGYLKENINNFSEKVKHSKKEKDPKNIIYYNTNELNLKQMQIIYLMYSNLEDDSFKDAVGRMIESDYQDKYTEYGGIISLDKEKINFIEMPSVEERLPKNNNRYHLSDTALKTPRLGEFHLHAVNMNNRKSANPSGTDLISSYVSIHIYGESHEFVITPIKKGKFNIDYYGGDMQDNPIAKIFDLGIYNY